MTTTPIAVEQLAFPDLVASPAGTSLLSIDQRFARFHENNPMVYLALRDRALALVRQGHKRIGIGMLVEVLRWSAMTTRGDDIYKIDNSYRSRFARMLIDNEPELVDAIETRKLTA